MVCIFLKCRNLKIPQIHTEGLFFYKKLFTHKYYKAIKKKIAIFFGNCQCQDLRFYAENIKEFSDKYWVYPYPAIYDPDHWYMPACILENCDLFVYQAEKEVTN